MNIYFSGLGGVGIGPLAEIAHDAGYHVVGSDSNASPLTRQLEARGITVHLNQDGSFLQETHTKQPLDWFVYTAALPADHPELVAAKSLGIRTGKRDEFLAMLIQEKNLKLIAIAGTHGKTTTTGMMIWALQRLGVPVSYSVGTTISFGASGSFVPGSEYFVYECDEYDRNLLHFSPFLSLLTSIDYDHPDTYPTEDDYRETFRRYISQSSHTIGWNKDLSYLSQPLGDTIWSLENSEVLPIHIAGEHNRRNATLIIKALEYLNIGSVEKNTTNLEQFPGTDRRFEKLANNLYSDYGHHPEEIAATLQLARELSDRVVLVYQPHQNWRQHFIRSDYTTQFALAEKVHWLPTYLTRENTEQPILTPEELTTNITNKEAIVYSDLNSELWQQIESYRSQGYLVLCMGAGTIDGWVRQQLGNSQ